MHPTPKRLTTWVIALVICLGLLAVAGTSRGQHGMPGEAEMHFIKLMDQYLNLSDRFVALAGEPVSAAYLAIEGIVEIYENRGEKARAIPHLQRILERQGDDRAIRTLIRFKLRDLYNETGHSDKALEELDRIIEENGR
ncbi:MAG: hypothetical protein D6696_03725 [Acidobacteria bacterium]|nr:MAG: hypothetical protein D6696_03725 [Acidobacteriota bacterium]